MSTPQELAAQMATKTDQQLQDMFARPADWSKEALDGAKAELEKRGIRIVVVPVQPPASNADYEVLPNGRKRFLKATNVDIIISIFLPGWGLMVGAWAFFVKGEQKRGTTMMIIGGIILFLVIISGQFNK
jgi:hypothetical protein